MVPAMIDIITEEDIRESNATNIAELLRYLSGVFVMEAPGGLPEFQPAIRGLTSSTFNEKILILIDGNPIYNPGFGGMDLSWLPITNIQKVEVVKGAISSLYGANAFGGIINIITKSGQESQGLQVSVLDRITKTVDTDETTHRYLYSVNTGEKKGSFDYFLSVEVLKNQGIQDLDTDLPEGPYRTTGFLSDANNGPQPVNSGDDNIYLSSKFGYDMGYKGRLTLFFNLSDIQKGYPSYLIKDDISTDLMYASLNYTTRVLPSYEISATAHWSDLDTRTEDSNSYQYHMEGDVYGGEVKNSFNLEGHNLIIGIDAKQEISSRHGGQEVCITCHKTRRHKASSYEGEITVDKTKCMGCHGGIVKFIGGESGLKDFGWEDKKSYNLGIYLQEEYTPIDKLMLMLGIRYDYNSDYDSLISPRGAISYELIDNLRGYITVGRAFRSPTESERRIIKDGNPDLDVESTVMYELGLKGEFFDKKTGFQISGFRYDMEDAIFWDTGNSLKYLNCEYIHTIYGMEVVIKQDITPNLNLSLNYTYMDTGDRDGMTGSDEMMGTDQTMMESNQMIPSDQLMAPDHKVVGAITYKDDKGYLIRIRGRYEDPRPSIILEDPGIKEMEPFTFKETEVSSFLLFDLTLGKGWEFHQGIIEDIQVLFSIDNLFDIDYEEVKGWRMPGTVYGIKFTGRF
ncbi:MAG: TonB-dependent receptor [Nitrospinae bacterium]|nr:TonB-dependent receptor [Nitrospinota bacterium]